MLDTSISLAFALHLLQGFIIMVYIDKSTGAEARRG